MNHTSRSLILARDAFSSASSPTEMICSSITTFKLLVFSFFVAFIVSVILDISKSFPPIM